MMVSSAIEQEIKEILDEGEALIYVEQPDSHFSMGNLGSVDSVIMTLIAITGLFGAGLGPVLSSFYLGDEHQHLIYSLTGVLVLLEVLLWIWLKIRGRRKLVYGITNQCIFEHVIGHDDLTYLYLEDIEEISQSAGNIDFFDASSLAMRALSFTSDMAAMNSDPTMIFYQLSDPDKVEKMVREAKRQRAKN
jgi:hypothetical protein